MHSYAPSSLLNIPPRRAWWRCCRNVFANRPPPCLRLCCQADRACSVRIGRASGQVKSEPRRGTQKHRSMKRSENNNAIKHITTSMLDFLSSFVSECRIAYSLHWYLPLAKQLENITISLQQGQRTKSTKPTNDILPDISRPQKDYGP